MDRPQPPTLRDFLEIRSSVLLDVSDGGTRVLLQANDSGTMQLYEAVWSGGTWSEPRRLTWHGEPVTGRYIPGSGDIVVQTDLGGNERHQLYRLSPDGAMSPLMVDPEHIHQLGDVDRQGRLAAYATNRRNGVDFDVHVLDLRSGDDVCVYDGGGWCHAGRFSPDGGHLTMARPGDEPMDSDILVADLARGTVVDATPHDGAALHEGVAWRADSSGFLMSSNAGGDMLGLVEYDLGTGRSRPLGPAAWDTTCVLSGDGRVLVTIANDDGGNRLEVLDAATLAPRGAVALPEPGLVTWPPTVPSPLLSDDGRTLVYTLTSARVPAGVWACDLATGVSVPVTRPRGAVTPEHMAAPTSHRIRSFDGEEIHLFLYRPAGATAAPRPAVVLVHGGPASQAVLRFDPVVQYLVSRGYGVVVPNVRGSTGYGKRFYSLDDGRRRLDSVRDLAAVHDWLPGAGLDPGRAALMGGSYGGYMVLAGLAFQPERWACGVDVVGISNLVTFLQNTSPYRRSHREREYGSLTADRDFLEQASPLNHAARIRAPLMVIHGSNDPRVPLSEAEQLARTVRGHGVPCDLLVYGDEGHGLARLENRLDAYPRVVAFLDGVLRAGAGGTAVTATANAPTVDAREGP